MEIFDSLNSWAEDNILVLLKPVERSWQPQDYLPDAASEAFHDEVRELQERARKIPDDYFVCFVGDMITEEALPTYQTVLNNLDGGVRDETGASPTSWAIWTRVWTAEENRYGDLMNKYLFLTGRVDMRQIEKTIQYLIGSGMDPKTDTNPYLGFVYTSFQERGDLHLPRQHGAAREAVRRSEAGPDLRHHRRRREAVRVGVRAHRGEAVRGGPGLHGARLRRHDAQEGEMQVSKKKEKCKIKSIFSGRHLRNRLFCFKIRVKERINGWILSWIVSPMFAQILKQNKRLQKYLLRKMPLKFSLYKKIASAKRYLLRKVSLKFSLSATRWPAHLMYDGQDVHLFARFSAVAQRLGVYTARDYADILEFLVRQWGVGELAGLSGEGRRAQQFVCSLGPRFRKLEERAQARAEEPEFAPFSWIYGRQVQL